MSKNAEGVFSDAFALRQTLRKKWLKPRLQPLFIDVFLSFAVFDDIIAICEHSVYIFDDVADIRAVIFNVSLELVDGLGYLVVACKEYSIVAEADAFFKLQKLLAVFFTLRGKSQGPYACTAVEEEILCVRGLVGACRSIVKKEC